MATQRFTIAKIAGDAGTLVLERMQRWAMARDNSAASNEFAPEQWPKWMHEEVDRFVESLRHHAAELPVVYFSEHIDMWSMGDVPIRFMSSPAGASPVEVASPRFELLCLSVPDGGELELTLKKVVRRRDVREYRWLAQRLLEAVDSWRPLVENAALVLVREVLGGLKTDGEVLEGVHEISSWIQIDHTHRPD